MELLPAAWLYLMIVQRTTSALRHKYTGKQGKGDFGLMASKPTWSMATTSEWRTLVVNEVCQQGKVTGRGKTGQGQGCIGKVWGEERLPGGNFGKWRHIVSALLSELLMTCFQHQGISSSGMARIQPVPSAQLKANLKHIMTGCLMQGRYTWWRNQVL